MKALYQAINRILLIILKMLILTMKAGRKPLKNVIKRKVVSLKALGRTDKQVLQKIPTISQSSISRIKKSNHDLIEKEKKKYIKLINSITGGDKTQAKTLRDCLNATTEVFNFKGEVVGLRPDHKIRLDTVKYIDKLKGRDNQVKQLNQNNTFISQQLDRFIG